MFRKIHSNREPQDTILSQLKTEFAPYVGKAAEAIMGLLKRKPKLIFYAMVASILVSAGLSFIILRNKEPAETGKSAQQVKLNVISDGFDQISSTAAAIQQTIRLKQQIDSLSAKRTLSKADSQTLVNDLDQLRHLNNPPIP
jgi:type I site-specific restriction endonuclease